MLRPLTSWLRARRGEGSPWFFPLCLGAAALLVAIFFTPVLTSSPHVPVAPGDGWLQNFPVRALIGAELRAGRLPAWNPYIFGGFPLAGDVQAAAFYPLTWLFAVLPPAAAFNLGLALSLILGFTFTAALARSLGLPAGAALLAGIVFAFSGYLVGNLGLTNLVEASIWLPAALWMGHRLAATGSPRFASLLGVALGLQFLAGHTQTSVISAIAVLAYLVTWLPEVVRTGRGTAVAAGVAVALAVAAVIAAPQIAASYPAYAESPRTSLSLPEFAAVPLRPRDFLLAVVPYIGLPDGKLGSTWSAFVGVLAASLAWLGWRCRQPRDGTVRWGVLLGLALVLAMGSGWPLAARLLFRMPLISSFRVPRRWVIVAILAVAVLAAEGVAKLLAARQREEQRRLARVLGEAAAILAAGGLLLVAIPEVSTASSPLHERVTMMRDSLITPHNRGSLAALLAVILLAIWVAKGRSAKIAVTCLTVFVAGELSTFNRRAEWRTVLHKPAAFAAPGQYVLGPVAEAIRADVNGSAGRVWTFYPNLDWGVTAAERDLDLFMPNDNAFTGVPNVAGYSPLLNRRLRDWVGMSPYGGGVRPEAAAPWLVAGQRLADVLAVRWLIHPDGWGPAATRGRGGPAAEADCLHGFVARRREGSMARVWFCPSAREVGEHELRSWLLGEDGGSSPAPGEQVVFLKGEARMGPEVTAGGAGSVRIRELRPGRISAEASSAAGGWVVLSESWMPGWMARLDGGPWLATARAYGVVQAVAVPPGSHTVEFVFRSAAVAWGLLAGAGGLLFGAGLVLANRRPRERSGSESRLPSR